MSLKFGPFDSSKIKLNELYTDCINYFKTIYNESGTYFSMASPMAQLAQVTMNMCRMILYYVEDSITELNIFTASRPQSIRGLARLTGHNPSRAIAARGSLKLSYNGKSHDVDGNVVVIPNYAELYNTTNNLSYIIELGANEARLNLNSAADSINVSILQGTLEYQTVTGSGTSLQSFNIQAKKGQSIDNFFVNVYVNGEKWESHESILDLSLNQKGVIIKTGQTGGIDIFFGNGFNGKVPDTGSVITIEYLITDGILGNLNTTNANISNAWKFKSSGYTMKSKSVDLNSVLNISIKDEIMFGTIEEPINLTRLIAPNTSRSFVLANASNYVYFLKKLNMFSIIDAFPGFKTFEDAYAKDSLAKAENVYNKELAKYNDCLKKYGELSEISKEQEIVLKKAKEIKEYWEAEVNNNKKDDNTVYLFLVPDISNKLSGGKNYFSANDETFILSENEKIAILDLIEESGQRVLTVDNIILTPKYINFAINVYLIIWENYDVDTIKNNIESKLSEYFIKNTRRDRIPVSDLSKIIENIEGVDSVTVSFDADKNNKNIFKDHYGLDEFGDVILNRHVTSSNGDKIEIKDIYPLFRGGFESILGVEYEKGYSENSLDALNISIRGITKKNYNSMNNANITSGI